MKKTAEQLHAQLESVNIKRKQDYAKPLNPVEGSFEVTPKDAREKILGELSGGERQEDEEFSNYYERKYSYNNYVYQLREMRKEQRAGIQESLTEVIGNRADGLAEAATFGTLRVQRLESIQPDNMSGGKLERVLTDEQVESARGSEEKFQEALRYALNRKPNLILRVLKFFPDSVSAEEARSFFGKAVEQKSRGILWDYEVIEPLYSRDENREQIERLLVGDPSSTFTAMSKPAIAKHFSPEERKKFVLDAVQNRANPQLDLEVVVPFVKQGVLSPGDLQDVVLNEFAQVNEHRRPEKLEMVADYFKDEPAKSRLSTALIKAYTRTTGALSLWGVDDFVEAGFLSQDQAKEIVKSRVEQKNSLIFDYDRVISKFLSEEEVRGYVRQAVENDPEDLFRAMYNESAVKLLSKEELKKVCLDVLETNPQILVRHFELVVDCLEDAGERKKAVGILLTEASPNQFVYETEKFFRELGVTDKKEQGLILKDKLLEQPEFDYVKEYNKPDSTIAGLFSKDEILEILKKQLELGAGNLLYNLSHVRELVGSDEELKKIVKVAMEKDPATVAYNVDSVAFLYSSDEMREFINRLAEDMRGGQVAIMDIEKWGPIVGEEFTWQFIKKQVVGNAPVIIYKLNEIWPFIPSGEQKNFVRDLTLISPFIALSERKKLESKDPELTEEKIIALAKGDSERWTLAPKQLAELFERYSKETGALERDLYIKQGMDLYLTLGQIQEHGLELGYRRALMHEELGLKREQVLLKTFHCLSLLAKENPSLLEKVQDVKSVDEIQSIVFEELARYMGLDGSVSSESQANFFSSMESPVPFTVYFLQYKNSPEHSSLLKGMFESMLQGKHREWKYGDLTEESLQELKDGQYLPKNLTLEQYKAWSEDEKGSLFETLAMDSHEATRAVRQDITDNLMHFDVPRLEGLSVSEEGLKIIANELSQLGQQLAVVNKEFGLLKKQADADSSKLEMLEFDKKQLEQKRQGLVTARGVIRLALLRPEELVAGYLLEGQDGKKKGDPLTQLIANLRREVGQDGQFVFDNIDQKLVGFRTQTQSKQNLESLDSSSADDLFLIGVRPVGSCQHYAHGSHNDCLLGYSGPDTKILMLRNEKGNVVARAVVRLLSQKDGSPAMHLERIYSSSLGKGVTKAMYGHVMKKAERLNMPLYTSERSQNEQGQEVEMVSVEGVNLTKTKERLSSFKTRAPKVYVDSSGGDRSFGKYNITNLVQIERV